MKTIAKLAVALALVAGFVSTAVADETEIGVVSSTLGVSLTRAAYTLRSLAPARRSSHATR